MIDRQPCVPTPGPVLYRAPTLQGGGVLCVCAGQRHTCSGATSLQDSMGGGTGSTPSTSGMLLLLPFAAASCHCMGHHCKRQQAPSSATACPVCTQCGTHRFSSHLCILCRVEVDLKAPLFQPLERVCTISSNSNSLWTGSGCSGCREPHQDPQSPSSGMPHMCIVSSILLSAVIWIATELSVLVSNTLSKTLSAMVF